MVLQVVEESEFASVNPKEESPIPGAGPAWTDDPTPEGPEDSGGGVGVSLPMVGPKSGAAEAFGAERFLKLRKPAGDAAPLEVEGGAAAGLLAKMAGGGSKWGKARMVAAATVQLDVKVKEKKKAKLSLRTATALAAMGHGVVRKKEKREKKPEKKPRKEDGVNHGPVNHGPDEQTATEDLVRHSDPHKAGLAPVVEEL